MRRILNIFLISLLPLSGFSQDIHFSQFFNSPIINNPANSGMFDADYRFAANQRVQWRSISSNPYNTFGFSADMNDPLNKEGFGAGFSFLHDITGDSRFRTLDLNLSGSYIFPVSSDTTHSVSVGLQTGLAIKSINYTDLSFDAQYDGSAYDPTMDNMENFNSNGRAYLNLALGATYFYRPKNDDRIWGEGGVSLFNITKPRQSFFNNDDIRRDRRLLITLRGSYPINYDWDLIPSFSLMFQGVYKELIAGTLGKYTLVNSHGIYRALYSGLFYRGGDAGYLFIGMDYDDWHVGLSYDLNLSNLRPASLKRGGWEVALIYKLRYFKYEPVKHKICPDYMR